MANPTEPQNTPQQPSGNQSPSSDDHLMAGFAYLGLILLFVPTIVIFLLKKDESQFIKFHCLQSMSFMLYTVLNFVIQSVLWVASGTLSIIPGLNILSGFAAMIIGFALWLLALPLMGYWIYIMIKAFSGETVRIPVIADYIDEKFGTN